MNANHIGLRSMATALPGRFASLDELTIHSEKANLNRFGFHGAWIGDDVSALALEAAEKALVNAHVSPKDIDVLIWASALPESHQRKSELAGDDVLHQFCYQGSWLQETLGLEKATVTGVAQQGCAGMFSAMRQARALLIAEPELQHILCLGVDVFPAEASREILYNIVSDAACACVISRDEIQYHWLGFHQISKGYYWDIPAKQSEIIAAYFPTAALTIRGLLKKHQLTAEDIDLVIPTGVNQTSWPILLRLCGIPETRLYEIQNRFGHTIAADSFLILEEARTRGALKAGMKILLFTYGFGSSWSALLLETTDLVLP